ncbi:LysM peptidoglycan-binding domain-containing protein [Rapidithrix thailandica]|uniref:LysM peptidoglycan-binding domain-containing protein n=1 Tax=Rapidithrix thailandica TaxID=413964 RepID=A0AAW9S4Y9_9BACT
MSLNNYPLLVLWTGLCFLGSFSTKAQQSQTEIDSTFTVEFPPDYHLFLGDLEEEVVAATAAQEEEVYQLSFDTTSAISIENIIQEYDYIPSVSDELVQDRLSCLQNRIPLNFHERVRLFIDYFSVRRREYTLTIMQRKNIYFPMFEKVLAEHGMPDELKYLSIIESALKPTARSRVGALGLWQFMPYTGRQFGLKQNFYMDERMDPEKATHAAAKYLRSLYKMFGDWELAIAAYNCGPGNVRKAQRRSGKKHFWDIYHKLPRETRSYLPQFVAMMYVLNYAEVHNLIQEFPNYEIPSEAVYISQAVDLGKLAKEMNVCYEDLKTLNPALRFGYIPKGVENFKLRIPSMRLDHFLNNSKEILEASKYDGKLVAVKGKGEKYYHVVRSGESLGLIAQRNRVSLSKLRVWNNLYHNRIYPGQKLVIYSAGATPPQRTQSKSSASQTPKPVTPKLVLGSGQVYVVQSGDTLWDIANKFKGLTVEKIKQMNKLSSSKLKPGQRLRIGG